MSELKPTSPPTHTNPTPGSANTLSHTTPFPNRLLDEVMPRLNDTQWRLLCVIVRQTLGWQKSKDDNNIRKQWDWLTREQLKRRTGRNEEALAAAIDTLTRHGYIVARNSSGQRLVTAQDRRRNQSRIYYSLAPELLQWLRSENNMDSGQKPDRPLSSPCSKIEHRQCEHQYGKANTTAVAGSTSGATLSSVYRADQRKIEHGAAGKSNTTKQTQTKETNTKRKDSQNFSLQRSRALEDAARQTFIEIPAVVPKSATLTAASPPVKDFIRLLEEMYAQQQQARPRIALSAADWQRLEDLLQKHPNLNWQPVLEKFMESDLGYVTRQNHSLLSFLNLCNFFLLRIPGALSASNTIRSAVKTERGWQRALPLPPGTIDQPNASL